ncbi:MAG: carboxypeptidase regulatory-like domain-containing protein [Longimicrobiales bacterium]
MRRFPGSRFSIACLVLALSGWPAEAAAQDASLRGRVVERGSTTVIAGATIQLSNGQQRITRADGRFEFNELRLDRYTLGASALGYRLSEVSLILRNDTTIEIQLEPAPIRLDSLVAEARIVTLSGRITDASSGRPIFDADVLLGADRRVLANANGGFRFGHVLASQPMLVEARALGYIPVQVEVVADRDTVIDFSLAVDPIAARMIEAQIARLADRVDATPHRATRITRDEVLLKSASTAFEIVQDRLGRNPIDCLFVDERVVLLEFENQLRSYLADEIEHIQIIRTREYGRQIAMVRVYTRRYMEQMIQGNVVLRPIILTWGIAQPVCR